MALHEYRIERLGALREAIASIKKSELTYEALLGAVRTKIDALRGLRPPLLILRELQGHESNTKVDVLEDVRANMVQLIDQRLAALTGQQAVRPILDELILKVRDAKLARLLNEFNEIRESAPNVAAVGFRTILCLVIQERAKLVNPEDPLASGDVSFEPSIRGAIEKKLFDGGETKLLNDYLTKGPKATFDNVAHKPGANALIEKDTLSFAVEMLLNKLLAQIVE